MNLKLAKMINWLTRGIFIYAPTLYFWAYRRYKRFSDDYLRELLNSLVAPGSNAVDVGAHIGYYTIELARLVGKEGRVLAFEPEEENYDHLTKNTRGFTQVEIFNLAVGDRSEMIKLYVSGDLNVDHRTYQVTSHKKGSIAPVRQVALDEIFKEKHLSVSFIKMDIQGYEYQALLGMKHILSVQRPTLVMELWPWGLVEAGSSVEHVVKFLAKLKYSIHLIDNDHKQLKKFALQELKNLADDYYDILCRPI